MDVVQVCWRLNGFDYVMVRVRPYELAALKKRYPDWFGIPTQWAVTDEGEVEWWPQSKEGELVVTLA